MNKLKLLSVISIGLLVSNIMLIAFILTRHPERPPHQEPKTILIERLHFTEHQIQQYDRLIEAHKNATRQSNDDIMQLKNQLYRSLSEETNAVFRDSMIAEISKVQMKIEQVHYNHFEQIKQLCQGEQLNLFNQLTNEIATIFLPKRPNDRR
jgi:hypothetical protein